MIDWKNSHHRAALLQLAAEGRMQQRSGWDGLLAFLQDESWVRQTRRSKELLLTEFGRREVLQILAARCPDWQKLVQELILLDGEISARSLGLLEKRTVRELRIRADLPSRLNRKTFNAAVTGWSKSNVSYTAQTTFPGVELSGDHGILIRSNRGFRLQRGSAIHDCDAQMQMMGVVYVSERFLRDAWESVGATPTGLLTVENPASFHDLKLPDGMMAVLVEGWNTPVALRFLLGLPKCIHLIHFGDFDPAGWHIRNHLQNHLARQIRWLLPDFAVDYVATHCLPFKNNDRTWQTLPPSVFDCTLLQRLSKEGKWLEQEAITLDSRLFDEIVAANG